MRKLEIFFLNCEDIEQAITMVELKTRVEIVSAAFTMQAITSLTKYSSVGLTITKSPIDHIPGGDTFGAVVFISCV